MGEQVANNKEVQTSISLIKHNGKYYTKKSTTAKSALIRNQYPVINESLVYPVKWGVKKASLTLINHVIEEEEKKLEMIKEKLELLREAKEQIEAMQDKKNFS